MAETGCMKAGPGATGLKTSRPWSRWHGQGGEEGKRRNAKPLNGNLVHLEVIETIMKLRLCEAYLRIRGLDRVEGTPFAGCFRRYPDLRSLRQGINAIDAARRDMEGSFARSGVELRLLRLSEAYGLDEFDQLVVQLLFVYQTSAEFRALCEACNHESRGSVFSMPSTGTILSILCPDYRSQLDHLPHFSVEGTLLGESILKAGSPGGKGPVMDVNMELDGQMVRFITGDDRRYKSDFSCIEVIRPAARLEQVVMDEALKKDLVEYAENFVRPANPSPCNDSFFGYGTGLTMLFHGPSGTGKTMMAHALADHLGKRLLAPRPEGIEELLDISATDILPRLFREARLGGDIVFLDECDDIIRAGSPASRAFLIEIERARCITILATNRVTDLDPALERRISLKVRFRLPEREERARIWQALLPPDVRVSDDVDFQELAERFVFTGGLIKNAVMMALRSAEKGGEKTVLSRKALLRAASCQAQAMFDGCSPEHSCSPGISINSLPVGAAEKAFLSRLPDAQGRSRETTGHGILCHLGCRDQETAVSCVEAVAAKCGLGVRLFRLADILDPRPREQRVFDHLVQEETDILDYVFSSRTGQESVVAVVDEQLELRHCLHDGEGVHRWRLFLKRASRFAGPVFVVSEPLRRALPFEFTCSLSIEPPPEELQIEAWQRHLPGEAEDAIIRLVERHPLHLGEIEEVASRAEITAMLEGNRREPRAGDILPVVKRFLGIGQTPVLFGKQGLDA